MWDVVAVAARLIPDEDDRKYVDSHPISFISFFFVVIVVFFFHYFISRRPGECGTFQKSRCLIGIIGVARLKLRAKEITKIRCRELFFRSLRVDNRNPQRWSLFNHAQVVMPCKQLSKMSPHISIINRGFALNTRTLIGLERSDVADLIKPEPRPVLIFDGRN